MDLTFLHALRSKLKGGNLRSVHLNALPGRFASRMDVANLNNIRGNLADKFLDTLLTKPNFEFQISFDGIDLNTVSNEDQKKLGLVSKRLNSLFIENEDGYKEHGVKTFGFGYPILIKRSKQDANRIIKAPLFIWPLELIKSTNKLNSWSILRNKIKNEKGKIIDDEIHSISLNEVLLSFINSDENILIPKINDELLEDDIIDKNELLDTCVSVLTSLNANSDKNLKSSLLLKLNEPIETLPEAKYFDSIVGNTPFIFLGGVFGLFRTQKESIITDIDIIIENYTKFKFENLKIEDYSGTPYSAIETDPSQQEILSTIGLEPKKIIQGPPGTGKSQSLTAIIINALANDLKCLVVCEKKTALDVIKNNLNAKNSIIGEFAAVIEDVNKDRDAIVNSVRDRIANLNSHPNIYHGQYGRFKEIIEKNVLTLNRQHKELDKKIYQNRTWSELVGEYLKRQKDNDPNILKGKLNHKEFKFQNDDNELSDIVEVIKQSKKLFGEIKHFHHPLDFLNSDLFQQPNSKVLQLKLEELSIELQSKIGKIKGYIIRYSSDLKQWLESNYKLYSVPLKNEIIGYLPIINGQMFTKNAVTPELKIELFVNASQKKFEELYKELEDQVEGYAEWLNDHYSNYYTNIKLLVNEYLVFAKESYEEFGDRLYNTDRTSQMRNRFLKFFSKKHKRLNDSQSYLISRISEIKKFQGSFNYIKHFYPDKKLETLEILVNNVFDLNAKVDRWYFDTEEERKKYFDKFCSTDVHKNYHQIEKVKDLELIFKRLLKELIANNIIDGERIDTDNINKILKFISVVVYKQFEEIKSDIVSFNANFDSLSKNITDIASNSRDVLSKIEDEKIFHDSVGPFDNLEILAKGLNSISQRLSTLLENSNDFRNYYNWRKFYTELSPLHQSIVSTLIKSEQEDWVSVFETWYYYWLLALNESSELPHSDDLINEIRNYKNELGKSQLNTIVSNWTVKQFFSLKRASREYVYPTSLYNKRGSKGERRNSLRKIIKTDFNLFTDFFPVVMVSPSVCSSIIPLKEGLFDLIIFDEASQLRLEDTYPALLRGKIKIVSGDSQQMPPSSYFQGGNATINPNEDGEEEAEIQQVHSEHNSRTIDNSLNLADSESLLVYAENSNYKQSYLKIHYRSHHPFLIDFSNHAFYGKRLIPMPAKNNYKPIQFIQVNGIYEDSVNRDEAKQIVNILLHKIDPFKNGKYPSVGIATFNLYQRNLILEEINRVRQLSREYDKKISDLGSDLFVKNLENIQGDERDIIIISTTFGRKNDNSFRQFFGPILQRNGYKLLNVIVTRAKYKVFVCTSIPDEYINQYSSLLTQHGNNGRGIFYAYLAYAKAVSEGNEETRITILNQLINNCTSKSHEIEYDVLGSESPFEEEVYYRLASHVGQDRIQQQYKLGGFRIDMVILSGKTGQPIIALECDGAKYHSSNEAYAWDMFRQKQLEEYGLKFYRIWSTNWWNSPESELKKLNNFIDEVDRTDKENIDDSDFIFGQIDVIISNAANKKRVLNNSIVIVKSPEGKLLKIRFSRSENTSPSRPDSNGDITIYERSPLAIALIGKTEGDICQLGVLEVYYEIVKVE